MIRCVCIIGCVKSTHQQRPHNFSITHTINHTENILWNFDGWHKEENGGIYHENAIDCPGGRKWAFWKGEVYDMLAESCAVWIRDYKCDGLRIDAALEVPTEVLQRMTHSLRETYANVLLTASTGSEDPWVGCVVWVGGGWVVVCMGCGVYGLWCVFVVVCLCCIVHVQVLVLNVCVILCYTTHLIPTPIPCLCNTPSPLGAA